jgi:H+/Cl- antiporter ClcA
VNDQARAFVKVLGLSAVLGALTAAAFELFETASHELRHQVWDEWAGPRPGAITTIALTTVGGVVLGLTLRFVPGRGGPHPAEHHGFAVPTDIGFSTVLGIVAAGFVALVAGASLGPEGAVLPAAAGAAAVVARRFRVPDQMAPVLPAAGMGALLAAMFGSPLAGAVPLLEIVPVTGAALTMVILPVLTASATAVLTLDAFDAAPAGVLQLGHDGIARGDLAWALLLGVGAGAVGLAVDRLVPWVRRVTRRLDGMRLAPVWSTALGGLVLGTIYAIAGDDVRFAGIPELQHLILRDPSAARAALAVVAKIVATAVCLGAGYRGGKIFPLAFAGGAAGLAVHAAFDAVPLDVAVAAGLAAAIATGLGTPVTAALIAGAVLGPELLPLAVVAVVAAHTVHLLADSVAPSDPSAVAATANKPL